MRTFLISVFLLSSIISNAQYYEFNYDVYFHFNTCGSNERFYNTMYYTTLYNSTPRELTDFAMYRQIGDKPCKRVINIPASEGPITRIWTNTGRQHYVDLWIGGYWDSRCSTDNTPIYNNPGSTASTVSNCFDVAKTGLGVWGWGCLQDCSPVSLNIFSLKPVLSVSTPNSPSNLIPTNDNITLQTAAGFIPSVYKWEVGQTKYDKLKGYYFEWNPLPARFQGINSFDINATDLLGASAESYIGQPLYFRINLGCGNYTNELILTTCLASPHITKVDAISPKCYGDKTGSAKIYFDRAIRLGESLNITLKDGRGMPASGGVSGITSLDADNSITLPGSLAADKYTIGLLGFYPSGQATYTDGLKHKSAFTVAAPPAVNFSSTKQNDVRCYGGNDGAIQLTATGGVGNYKVGYKKSSQPNYTWQNFSTATTHTIAGLDTGKYNIIVRDANDCFEKNVMNKEVIDTVIINQPAEPVKIDFSEVTDPLGYGRTDGNIKVIVKGGTKKGDGSYNITWKKEDGTVLSTVASTNLGATYQSVLQNIGKGKYIVNITDANFSVAASASTEGCMLIDTFNVNEPPPIVINIVQQKYILCKGDAAGELVAHVSGGVPYTTGATVPYKYQWFRREATDIDLAKTDSLISDLKAGNYILKVTDKNGVEKLSDVFILKEPDSLKINFSTTVNACTATGNITANITGGTAPYHIEWTTGDTTTAIQNQTAGNYLAYVKDANSCGTQATVKLQIPGAIAISNVATNPTYYNSKDGSIQLTISGGNPPYSYQWNNGAITKDIQNLTAGIYSVTITDSRGCTKVESYTLQNPPRIIQIGGTPLGNGITTKTLCNGQHLDVDATIADNAATYQWNSTNGFSATTAKVSLTTAGKYWITVTDSRGITASDTLIIKQNNANINASFVITTQAFRGEKVTFFNISSPAADHIEWLIPNDPKIEITQNYQNLAEVIFKDTGTYAISMKAFVGQCEQVITKKVIVVEGTNLDDIGQTQNPFVKEFTIMPNPNTGQFNVKVVLQEQAKIRLRMMNVSNSALINDKELSGSSQYMIPYTITAASGVYILLLETPKGNQIQKIIIN